MSQAGGGEPSLLAWQSFAMQVNAAGHGEWGTFVSSQKVPRANAASYGGVGLDYWPGNHSLCGRMSPSALEMASAIGS